MITDGYREEDLKYVWKGDHPVQTNPGYEGFVVPTSKGIKMKIPTAERCDVVTSTGKYSCLRLKMVFFKEFSKANWKLLKGVYTCEQRGRSNSKNSSKTLTIVFLST